MWRGKDNERNNTSFKLRGQIISCDIRKEYGIDICVRRCPEK
jgi:hypothetical protein